MLPHVATRRKAELALTIAAWLIPTIAALAFAHRYAVDWLFNDDLTTIRWFQQWDAGTLGVGSLLRLWNNEHPVGAQFAVMVLMRMLLGLDFKALVYLSFIVISATAVLAARRANAAQPATATRLGITFACFVLAFHPTQMEHLLWAFELGWFLVNAIGLANALLTERFERAAVWPSAVLCLVASLASAQGAMTWFAAGAHQALLPGGRRRRAIAALPLLLCGMLAVIRLETRPHLAAAAGGDADPLAWLVYALQILGGASGSRRHDVLLATGGAFVALPLALFWLRRDTPDQGRLRIAAVLVGFSALCVAGFTQGRHALGIDWAIASFHAAPFLVPFFLGLVMLMVAPARTSRRRRADTVITVVLTVLLAATVVAASGYGATRARLWAMDRGYARWATCRSTVPSIVMARGSGVAFDLSGFDTARPLIDEMCRGPTGPLEMGLVLRPRLFDQLAAGRPDVGRALDALWQDYATELMLQLAFKPEEADTPQRLLAFARVNAKKGSELDPDRLGPFADIYCSLAP